MAAAANTVTGAISNVFTPFLNGVKATATSNSSFFGNMFGTSSASSSFNNVSSSSSISSMGKVITYVVAALVILLFILIMIHFFITPVFQYLPGGPGIIPIPGGDDGVVFWKDGSHAILYDDNVSGRTPQIPISGKSWGYSMIIDMFIQNPIQFSNQYRVLFSRGAVPKSPASTGSVDTFLGMFDNYNLIVALKPDTNDLVVSVLSGSSTTKSEENVVISNVPVQQSFRLGIIVMEKAVEVYLNGNLVKTRNYDYAIQSVTGPIQAETGPITTSTLYPLLKIWNRILTTSEMRYASPALTMSSPSGALPMPAGSSCSAISSAASDAASAVSTAVASTSHIASQARSALASFN